jgi:tRNA pseudouridine32 synthase/23S rRNA pseudouridine746 synthase
MRDNCFIPFYTAIDASIIPDKLNDPYDVTTPEICKTAAHELAQFLTENQHNWQHNFGLDNPHGNTGKGKMFGVLAVKNTHGELGYLCTFSGKLADEPHDPRFVPSLFDIATNDYFITKGMLELSAMGDQIKRMDNTAEIERLKQARREKSVVLQQQLFDHYHFLNQKRESKSLCDIFETYTNRKPPAGAGECATPKLLHYAFKHQMKPLAVAEFWWGKATKSGDRQHMRFYPPCNDKCFPILKYMLDGVVL